MPWLPGSWCDVAAHPDGYAFVRVAEDLETIIAEVNGAVVWEQDAGGIARYLRCAVDSSTGEVRAIATVEVAGVDQAILIADGTATPITATFGQRPVMLTFEAGAFVMYICDTAYTYLRQPVGGAATSNTNPFAGGTTQGMLDVVAAVVSWAESTTVPGQIASTVLGGVTFQVPMTRGAVTVGQAVGAPVTAEGIIAWNGTAVSTIFPMQGWDPHVALIAAGPLAGKYVICARTVTYNGGNAALATAPPWPVYDGEAVVGRGAFYPPFRADVLSDRKTGKFSDPWVGWIEDVVQLIKQPIDVGAAGITGQLPEGSGGTGGSQGLSNLNANDLKSGTVPQARKWLELVTTAVGTQNDFVIGPNDQVTANNATPLTFTGFVAGVPAQRLVVVNKSASTVTLTNEDAGSLAANRILTADGASLVLDPNQSALLVYEGDTDRWRVVSSGAGGGGFPDATYLTVDDESADLPNSRQLLAGAGVTFDDSVANERTVNADPSTVGYWTPLTDGDPDDPQIIFAAGEVVMVWVPTP